ncbi:C6 transcription factor [Pleurostoma richardsiae]|uniref:C6 transcription factor n=1 Tax=Pleurostoma richardsiae TaxID=41990 RepID=A0AA38RD52_9PEZI|nr:C6 transcription factor [Pleurostoma richardsiae]
MAKRGPSHSSPYGLACTHCFKSKCKCVARPDGDGCQRKQDSSASIAELKSKVDGLISELRLRNVLDDNAAQQRSPPEPLSQPAARASALDVAENAAEDSTHAGDGEAETTSEISGLPDSTAEAESLLSTFRSRMLHHCAFVHLPSELTSHQLRRDRPFLFRAIVCVVCPSTREKVSRSRKLKVAFHKAMLLHEGQSSMDKMDLLLGLLTYVAWGWDHVLSRCSLARLMMQAMSLACEMQLNKPTTQDAKMMALFAPGFESWSGSTDTMTTQEFLDRQRALLGCFMLSSAVSAYFGQPDVLRWTPQMEDSLAAISTNKECPTDVAFAMQVRLQLLAQKAVWVHQQQGLEQGQAPTEAAAFPELMSLSALQGQLQELQTSLPSSLSSQALIMAHIHSAELSINETTHAVHSMVPLLVRQFARIISGSMSTTRSNSAGHERSQCLWRCVRAIKACTSVLMDVSPADFAGVSFLQWAQLARCVMVLNHLTTTIEDPAWDRAAVRAVIDIPVLLDRVAEKLELASQAAGEQRPDDVFAQLARTMREFRSDVTGSVAHEHQVAEDVDAEWSRSRLYGGAGAGRAVRMMGL